MEQWTALLDLLEIALGKAGISFVRLDGSMPLHLRAQAIRKLQGTANFPAKRGRGQDRDSGVVRLVRLFNWALLLIGGLY